MNGFYARWTGRMLLLCVVLAAPACNESREVPGPNAPPKPETQKMSGYEDEATKDEAELKSAIFTYSKHKGKQAEEDERPLADTVIRVTT